MIAADEDLSSPDEPDYPHPSAWKQKSTTVEESESDEETPTILTPMKLREPQKHKPIPKASPKPLKSALDIELTDSGEEEDSAVVAEDEDYPSTKSRSVKLVQFNGKNQKLEDIFEPPRSTDRKKSENKGLMLQFAANPSPAASPAVAKVSKEADTPSEESPDQKRRRDKKKKSKRSKSVKEEDGAAAGSSVGGQGGGEEASRNGRTGSLSGTNPYGVIASLDAWLNSDDTGTLVRVRVQ